MGSSNAASIPVYSRFQIVMVPWLQQEIVIMKWRGAQVPHNQAPGDKRAGADKRAAAAASKRLANPHKSAGSVEPAAPAVRRHSIGGSVDQDPTASAGASACPFMSRKDVPLPSLADKPRDAKRGHHAKPVELHIRQLDVHHDDSDDGDHDVDGGDGKDDDDRDDNRRDAEAKRSRSTKDARRGSGGIVTFPSRLSSKVMPLDVSVPTAADAGDDLIPDALRLLGHDSSESLEDGMGAQQDSESSSPDLLLSSSQPEIVQPKRVRRASIEAVNGGFGGSRIGSLRDIPSEELIDPRKLSATRRRSSQMRRDRSGQSMSRAGSRRLSPGKAESHDQTAASEPESEEQKSLGSGVSSQHSALHALRKIMDK